MDFMEWGWGKDFVVSKADQGKEGRGKSRPTVSETHLEPSQKREIKEIGSGG